MLGEKEEKDPDAEKKEEERQEALRQQEEERKAKYAKMEAERESLRQGIRDKVRVKRNSLQVLYLSQITCRNNYTTIYIQENIQGLAI